MNIGINYNRHLSAIDYKTKYISNIFYATDMTDNAKTLYPDKKTTTVNYSALLYVENLKSAAGFLKQAVTDLRQSIVNDMT